VSGCAVTHAPFTVDEVVSALQGTSNKSSPGPDLVPYGALKAAPACILEGIAAAGTQMLRVRRVPASAHSASGVPLPKVEGVPRVSELRPISVLNTAWQTRSTTLVEDTPIQRSYSGARHSRSRTTTKSTAK
jgi:hypothetical protein